MIWQGWTSEADAELIRLFDKGWSFSQIGAALGCSRNAALGRAHRAGLKRGKPTSLYGMDRAHRSNAELAAKAAGVKAPARKPPAPPKPTATSIRVSSNGRRAYPVSIGVVPAPSPIHDGPTVALADLGAHACRWPYGDPDRAGFGFCGKPTAGDGPYCSSCIQDHKPYQRPTGFLSDRRLLDTGRKHRRTNAPTFDDYERKAGWA